MSLDPRRYLQRGDIGGTDIDTARRTNRFDASNPDIVACACTKHRQARPGAADCNVCRINIIICPERAATCGADESRGQGNETPSGKDQRNKAVSTDSFKNASYGFATTLQRANFVTDEGHLEDLPTSTPLRALKTEILEETSQATERMQDKSVETEFAKDASSEAPSKTLLDLLRDDRVQPRRCFCSEPRIVPRGIRRVIAVNTMKRIPACQRSNNVYACRKFNRRHFVRYYPTNNGEVDGLHGASSKSKDEDRPFNMYSNPSDHEALRTDKKRSDRVAKTTSRSRVEDRSKRPRDSMEHSWNNQDVRKEWTYVEYLMNDTLRLLGGTSALGEKRLKIRETRKENRNGRLCEARTSTGVD
ncbi:hypothetical protein EAI_11589 [Harpegnathos saltator]|uniref:Uncharacterized protein n=1 Tax=Harpegnathos saltator TaxID=610380 RepID=E2BF05_HARSA|nr:hypothetical protein EAI_11589 [Harpegnathos saltator]